MTSLRAIVDNILVPHTAFEGALTRLEQSLAYVREGAHEPTCIAIVGESRSGKSRLCERFATAYAPIRLHDGLQVRVLSIVVPSKPTVKGLAELLLQALGDPNWDKGSENVKTARLITLMRACGVMMLMLDEFQHFYDKGSHRVQHHVADWLKNLVTVTRVALTVSGLPSLQAVINHNEQLRGRFGDQIRMPRFDWLNAEHRSEWIGILGAFTEGLSKHFDVPELDGDNLALRTYCATGGLMGYLCKTLRQAVWNALDASTRTITLADLQRAHQTAVWSSEGLASFPNPFDAAQLVFPSPEAITQSKLVGASIPEEHEQSAPNRRKTANQGSVCTVLVA